MMLVLRVRRSGGFSLIELLAASVIVGILASVAVPFMETALKRQKEQALRVALRDIRNAIDAYKQATSDGRIKIEDGKTGYPASLLELTDGIEDAKDPKKPRLVFCVEFRVIHFMETAESRLPVPGDYAVTLLQASNRRWATMCLTCTPCRTGQA